MARGEVMSFWVYILASKRNGTLYIGQTNDLPLRIWQHRNDLTPGFTTKYDVKMLVLAEPCPTRDEARVRESRLKKWNRDWKLKLIEEANPEWQDLYLTINDWYSRDS
jgi:putative endonuclease